MNADISGGILDPDGAMAELAAWQGRIDQLAADTQTMSDRLRELRVTTRDENGLVEVTIDSAGALTGLRLGPRIQQTDPDTVAQTIMRTIRQARDEAADRSREILTETLGTESPAARAIADRVGRQLRGAEPPADDPDGR